MKKFLLILAVVAMLLPGCKKIEESIDALENRIDKLEQETIPTIDEQIAAINLSLDALEKADEELGKYIQDLEAVAANLQEQINDTNIKIDEVKVALQNEISTAKADVLAQLDAVKAELEAELATINATIETLKAKDAELDKKIADLRSYVDSELGKTTDWVNATFATLEQYNSLVSELATIKEQIKAIDQSITELESRLTTKINEYIATAVSTLNADIQQKVKDITDAYTNAIKSAKEEITSAYTTAIQNAINALDVSLKAWVGEQLANYYTIAEVEAKITALQTAITDGDATLQEELNKLKSQLETTSTEITAAYKKAIEEAINTNNGVIDTKIANEIASVNQRIANEVATINAKIAEIETRLDNVEAKIAGLLARIQSVSYIPTYDDGKATVKYNGDTSRVTLDFEVSPKDAVVELAKVWQSAVTVKAIYTQTRAVSFIDMPIVDFESDPVNGVISVTASAENLSAEFFSGAQSASARLSISDGSSSVVSDYIPMVAKEITNEIWYTSTDGKIIVPNRTDVFGVNMVSNTYKNGKGVIVFDGMITEIGESAFRNCLELASITMPNSITSIGRNAFFHCSTLKSISIPNRVTRIENETFRDCSSLTNISIPNGILSIGSYAIYNCDSLTNITIPNSVISIEEDAFGSNESLCAFNGKFVSEDHRCLIEDGVLRFFAPAQLSEYTIPQEVSRIGRSAFSYCYELISVTIPESVTYIEPWAFSSCVFLSNVFCKAKVPPVIEYELFDDEVIVKMKVYVPKGAATINAYRTAEYWCNYNIIGYNFEE